MVARALDALLFLAAMVGAIYAIRSGREAARLEAEHERVTRKVGELEIVDPAKVYLRAIQTDDPLEFAWRYYLPAKYPLNVVHSNGSSSSWGLEPKQGVARVRLRPNKHQNVQVFTKFTGGSSLTTLGNVELVEVALRHPDQLRIEQLGRDDQVELEVDEPATLLTIHVPEELLGNESDEGSGKPSADRGLLYRFGLAPPKQTP